MPGAPCAARDGCAQVVCPVRPQACRRTVAQGGSGVPPLPPCDSLPPPPSRLRPACAPFALVCREGLEGGRWGGKRGKAVRRPSI
eukprot:scaffold227107_cov30-Tisochrysis_lutea.AAC.2